MNDIKCFCATMVLIALIMCGSLSIQNWRSENTRRMEMIYRREERLEP